MDTEDLLAVLEVGTDSILVHDGALPLYCNRNFLNLFGYDNAEEYQCCVEKNGLFKRFHPDDIARVVDSHNDRMEGNSRITKHYSARVIRDVHDVRWIDLKISSIEWQGSHAVMVAIQDSTESTNKSRSNTHFQSLFTHILSTTPAIITLTSIGTGEYFHVSDMFESVMGYDKKSIIGRSSFDLKIWVHDHERQFIADELRAGRSVEDFACSVYSEAGDAFPMAVWARVIKSEPEDMLFIVAFDRREEVKRLEKIESLNTELEFLATTDSLTGCLNRGGIEGRLKSEFDRYQRSAEVFSVLLFDIDFFKKINDGYGHDVGDTVLKEVVNGLSKDLRSIDLLGRWGGEEFLLLLPGTGLDRAVILADRLRAAVAATAFPTDDVTLRVTVSVGVSACDNGSVTPEGLIKAADQRLYRAKALGRNRVVMDDGEASEHYKI